MKRIITLLIWYVLFDASCIFLNHFSKKPQDNFLIAWKGMFVDIGRTLYYGNDPSVIGVIGLVIVILILCFFVSWALVNTAHDNNE